MGPSVEAFHIAKQLGMQDFLLDADGFDGFVFMEPQRFVYVTRFDDILAESLIDLGRSRSGT